MLTGSATRGFTLVEALVALAILLAGLAGSATLLLQTVRQERESGTRRAALRLASSMADQLRAIRRPDDRPVLAISGMDPALACAEDPNSCAAEQAAAHLIAAWVEDAALALPRGASVGVAVPDPLISVYLISIDWPSAGGGLQQLRLPVTT